MAETSFGPASQAAPEISEKLRWSRQQLLDLTLRNRLLKFAPGAPDFKEDATRVPKYLALEADFNQTWKTLLDDERAVRIVASPLLDGNSPGAGSRSARGADLCARVDEEHLGKRLLKLFREREMLESSTGDSAFFLALGFLEWTEAPPKDPKARYAPLLLLHVRLVRKNAPSGGPRSFVLEMDADEHTGNPCLSEKLRIDHDLVLPTPTDIASPEAYLCEVEAAIGPKKAWRVHRTAALGFFNFARYRLWLDLDEGQWPPGGAPSHHQIVRDLIDQKWRGDSQPLPSDTEIAERQQEDDLPVVLNADSTQYAALLAAERGQSLVVIGPPGSGKSQTIANLIAVSIAAGKRVLFVAQKRAALEVVESRLSDAGLKPFCLALHSNQAKPADVHRQLRLAATDAARQQSRAVAEEVTPGDLARRLNDVASRLAAKPSGSRFSASEVLQAACVLRARAKEAWADGWSDDLLEIEAPEGGIPGGWMEERERALCQWAKLKAEAGDHWEGWVPLKLFAMDLGKVDRALRAIVDAADRLDQALDALPPTIRTLTVPQMESVCNQVERAPLPDPVLPALLQLTFGVVDDMSRIHRLERLLQDYHRQLDRALDVLHDPAGDRQEHAQKILDATATVGACLRPELPLTLAGSALADMSDVLNQANDFIAVAGVYSTAVGLINSDASESPTWATVDALAHMQQRAELESIPLLQIFLARYLANNRIRLPEALALADRLERMREVNRRTATGLQSLLVLPHAERAALRERSASLNQMGLGRVRRDDLNRLRLAAQRLVSETRAVLSLDPLSREALRLLAGEPAAGACRRLASSQLTYDRAQIEPPSGAIPSLVDAVARGAAQLEDLPSWASALQGARSMRSRAQSVLQRASTSDRAEVFIPLSLDQSLRALCSRGGATATAALLRKVHSVLEGGVALLDSAEKQYAELARVLRQQKPTSVGEIRRLSNLARQLCGLPKLPPALLDRVSSRADVDRVRQAVARGASLLEKRKALSARFALSDLPGREDVGSIRRTLRSHQGRLLRWFSPAYRAARRSVRSFANPPAPPDAEVIADLEEAESFLADTEAFGSDKQVGALLGTRFEGAQTDWSGVPAVLDWADAFYAEVADVQLTLPQLETIARKGSAALERMVLLAEAVAKFESSLFTQYYWCLAGESRRYTAEGRAPDECRISGFRQELITVASELGALSCELERRGYPAQLEFQEIVDAAHQWRSADAALQALAPLEAAAMARTDSLEPAAIRTTYEWYVTSAGKGLSAAFLSWIAARGRDAVEATVSAVAAAKRWAASADELASIVGGADWLASVVLEDIAAAAARLLDHVTLIERWMPSEFRAEQPLAHLDLALAELNEADATKEFAASWDEALAERACEVEPELVRRTAAWVGLTFEAGITEPLLSWCLAADTGVRLRWWQDLVRAALALRERTDSLLPAGLVRGEELGGGMPLKTWLDTVADRYATLASSLEFLKRSARSEESSVRQLSAAGAALGHACRLAGEMEPWRGVLGINPTELRAEQVAAHRKWVRSAASWSVGLGAWISDREPASRYLTLSTLGSAAGAVGDASSSLLDTLRSFGEVRSRGPAGVGDSEVTVDDLKERTVRLQKALPRLLSWANCQREEFEAVDLGLTPLLRHGGEQSVPPELLLTAFRAAVAFQQAKAHWQSDRKLAALRGSEHEELRRRFADADQSRLEKNRMVVAQSIRSRPWGLTLPGRAAATPEMYAVLKHEEQKQRKHLPVRRLVERAGPAIQQFCPCWLMTPLAVAQFLPPGKMEFDMVVMDEASQLPPEDAWGAVARGKQLIVVGDPRQMPPSDFFATAVVEDEDERPEEEEPSGAKLDSILDTASNCLPHSWLEWHYRSRHQSLIAPANRFSYGDRLILFPSSFEAHSQMGVRHTFVPQASTTTGRVVNSREAAALVDRLVAIALEQSSKPVGNTSPVCNVFHW